MTSSATPAWCHEKRDEVERLLSLYPQKRSAILPLLHLAQEARGYLTEEDFAAIGELVGETTAYVESTASFYAMYRRKPHGKYLVIVCEGLSCMLGGCEQLKARLEDLLGIKAGETTPDGLVTLEATHECLAACEGAPCLQVNHEYYLNVDEQKAARLVESIRASAASGHVGDVYQLALKPEVAPAPMTKNGRQGETTAPAAQGR